MVQISFLRLWYGWLLASTLLNDRAKSLTDYLELLDTLTLSTETRCTVLVDIWHFVLLRSKQYEN